MQMKQKVQIKVIGFVFVVFILFRLFSNKEIISINEINIDKIENFDIILSKGQSVQSKLISLLKLRMEDYSHIGVIIKEGNNVFILHSTPDGTKTNGIRYDDLQTFINLSNVNDFTILRCQNISSDCNLKLRKEIISYKSIKAPFDYDFNNFDNKKIYCSELVWLIFTKANLLTEREFNPDKPIYPKYFLKINELIKFNCKKTSP